MESGVEAPQLGLPLWLEGGPAPLVLWLRVSHLTWLVRMEFYLGTKELCQLLSARPVYKGPVSDKFTFASQRKGRLVLGELHSLWRYFGYVWRPQMSESPKGLAKKCAFQAAPRPKSEWLGTFLITTPWHQCIPRCAEIWKPGGGARGWLCW